MNGAEERLFGPFLLQGLRQYEMTQGLRHGHQAALRALASSEFAFLHRCWVDRTPYDEARYLMAR
jgi:hypothetical protein